MQNNTIIVSNNDNSGYGLWFSLPSMNIIGDVRGNIFTASRNGFLGYGWESQAEITITGDVRDNVFTASGNGLIGEGWVIRDSSITSEGNVQGNTFVSVGNTNEGFGWEIDSFYQAVMIHGNVQDNTFTISKNAQHGNGWVMRDIMLTIGGLVRNNRMSIAGNGGSNVGICLILDGLAVNTFEQAIRDNTFLINGLYSGEYGFYLDTQTGGTINFNGNSSNTNLMELNNNASVFEDEGLGSINYNGS
jgi:hypothetical protein